MRYLFEKHKSEWGGICERSEQYINKELGGDLEIEEIVIASGRKAVRERFEIKVVDGKWFTLVIKVLIYIKIYLPISLKLLSQTNYYPRACQDCRYYSYY